MILCLPFLLAILALIINLGIETKWKLRALSVSRQAVWRQRNPRNGGNDPRPASWPVQRATFGVVDNPPPPLFPQDPLASHTVTRGPVLRNPQVGTPESQLLVDTRMLDIAGSVQMGQARIDRGFPIFPKLPGVHLRVDHLLIDSQWRFWEMGFGGNETRRGLLLYGFTPPGPVVSAAQKFQQAALAIVSAAFRRDLDVLDRDDELIAWFGPPAPDFHPAFNAYCPANAISCDNCTLNRFSVWDNEVRNVVRKVQGRTGGGREGVPERVTQAFIQLYQSQISWHKAQMPPNEAEIMRLNELVKVLERFKSSLN